MIASVEDIILCVCVLPQFLGIPMLMRRHQQQDSSLQSSRDIRTRNLRFHIEILMPAMIGFALRHLAVHFVQ